MQIFLEPAHLDTNSAKNHLLEKETNNGVERIFDTCFRESSYSKVLVLNHEKKIVKTSFLSAEGE
jgi:hypothetical protein